MSKKPKEINLADDKEIYISLLILSPVMIMITWILPLFVADTNLLTSFVNPMLYIFSAILLILGIIMYIRFKLHSRKLRKLTMKKGFYQSDADVPDYMWIFLLLGIAVGVIFLLFTWINSIP